jgi:dTMP kinase
MLIAFEGVDSSGKATATDFLSKYLTAHGKQVKSLSFPRYDGPVGPLIYELLQTPDARPELKQALMLADRLAAVNELTDTSMITICDRYVMSGVVYGLADGLNEPWLYKMHQTLPKADIQILMDVDPALGAKRRGAPRDENEKNLDKLQIIREKYLSIWNTNRQHSVGTWYIVNASVSPANVQHQLISVYTDAMKHQAWRLSAYAAH